MQEASRSILYFPIPVGRRTDFLFDGLLRPAADTRLRLNLFLFLNLDLSSSCSHAFTYAKKTEHAFGDFLCAEPA